MENYFSNITPQRIITFVVCTGIIVLWIRFKWKRTSRYVEGRNELYSQHYRKMNEYAMRVRQDSRWSGFLSQMQSMHQVMDTGTPPDDQTFVVHHCFIWDDTGKQFEPGEDTAGRTSMSAFLKRKVKPKYLRFQLNPAGEVTEHKVSGSAWYDMFEKSV